MDADTRQIPASNEQRWERIIAAVRGSTMAEVWFKYKFGPQPPVAASHKKSTASV